MLPLGVVTGNGTFSISGVGGTPAGADGQGASLVVLYRVPGSVRTGRLIIRHGAVSATGAGQVISNTFSGLNVPSEPAPRAPARRHGRRPVRATEGAMLFNGGAVSPVDFYNGTRGPMWDDDRMIVPAASLPAGTTTRTNRLSVGTDCLAMAYSALAYQTQP